jgi:hypothetical protein
VASKSHTSLKSDIQNARYPAQSIKLAIVCCHQTRNRLKDSRLGIDRKQFGKLPNEVELFLNNPIELIVDVDSEQVANEKYLLKGRDVRFVNQLWVFGP